MDAPRTPTPKKEPTAAGPTLKKSEVTPRTDDGCGGYHWSVKWELSGAADKTDGFVVQQVTFNNKHIHCEGGKIDFNKRFWEAWQVRGGKIYAGTSPKQLHEADEFTQGPSTDEKGFNTQDGKAKFMPGYTEPLKWGKVHEAKGLPATEREPDGWSTTGAIERDVKTTFDCCGKNRESKIEGNG